MILGNFLGVDPDYGGSGLRRNNQIQKMVWDEFSKHTDHLHRVALAIRAAIDLQRPEEAPNIIGLEEDEVFPEGAVLTRLHLQRERNHRAVERKKQQVLQQTGSLSCEACGFDFEKVYDALGRGFAECHHLILLTDLPLARATKLDDLAIVCSNCHRMLHRSRPICSIPELRSLVHRAALGIESKGE
jgi:5-methylcytosine-specific restriction protein A